MSEEQLFHFIDIGAYAGHKKYRESLKRDIRFHVQQEKKSMFLDMKQKGYLAENTYKECEQEYIGEIEQKEHKNEK